MAELKTRPRKASVPAFVKTFSDPRLRADLSELIRLMRGVTGAPPRMWGSSIVGFGDYHYVYDSGREGDWFLLGFAPRKKDLTIYVMSGLDNHRELLAKLGPHKSGKGCLYIRALRDLHLPTLKKLFSASVRETLKRYGG